MPIYANGPGIVQTNAVGTAPTLIWDTQNSGIPSGATLNDVTVENIGSNTVFVGQSAVTTTTGLKLQAGAQMTIRGYSASQSATTGRIYACATAGSLSTVVAGLATVDPVV